MKCDICKINMYAMTPHYMDFDNKNLYCESCYKNELIGKGKVLTVITPSFKDYEKILRQIKRIKKLKKAEEKIRKSLDYYRLKLAEYVLQNGTEGGGFTYGMQLSINENINISASPLFTWNRWNNEIDERVSVHIYDKKTGESFSIYSEKS